MAKLFNSQMSKYTSIKSRDPPKKGLNILHNLVAIDFHKMRYVGSYIQLRRLDICNKHPKSVQHTRL